MDREDYIKKVESELRNNETYKEIKCDQTTKVTNKVRKIVKELFNKGLIDDKLKQYMMPNNTRAGVVKANPKMHKENNPMRIIVSSLNHPTEKIAEVAEKELGEWVENLPSYIKDTTDFLKKIVELKDSLPEDAILFTMDVKSLYPSIPKLEALQACKIALDHRTNKEIPTEAIMTLIQTVLDYNIFKFNETNYIQIDGTAIGSKLGQNIHG